MSFWEGFLNPNSSFEECLAYFDHQFQDRQNYIFFQKPLNDITKIKVWFSTDKITAIELAIIEAAEIFPHYKFDPENGFTTLSQCYSLLIKWLFDCNYLNLSEEIYGHGLTLDHSEILAFTQKYLKNHIWDTQLKDIPHLRSFLFKISSNNSLESHTGGTINFYIKNLYLKVASKWEEWQKFYTEDYKSMDDFERSIRLDPIQSRQFLAILTEYFVLFAQLSKETSQIS